MIECMLLTYTLFLDTVEQSSGISKRTLLRNRAIMAQFPLGIVRNFWFRQSFFSDEKSYVTVTVTLTEEANPSAPVAVIVTV